MFFSDKSDLEILDFKPRNHCVSALRVEWKGLVLNGSIAGYAPLIDLSEQDLTTLVFDFFGPLGLIEIAELYWALESSSISKDQVDWKHFMSLQNRQWNERQQQLFSQLRKLPESFLNWAHEKQLENKDLLPLNSLQDTEDFKKLSIYFREQNISHSQGKKIVDLLVDLLLLKTPLETLKPSENLDWFQQLYQLRNPMTLKKDQASKASSSWPQYVQIQKQRQGDRLLSKMQILYSDDQDLSKKLQRLSQAENSQP